ncbi:MAG: carbohydrate ABC transporter permease [Firmicutes bacterium]|nr:carbohydrate ABC transporter permease [Bacillota bacterium]
MKPRRISIVVTILLLAMVSIVMIFPFYWMLISSFKPIGRIFTVPLDVFPREFTLASYKKLITQTPFLRWYFNSVLITAAYTLLALFFSTLAGFGFAKYDFKGKNVLLVIVLGSMMIPLHSLVIPLFMLLIRLGWVNTYHGVVIPFAANAFGIFYISQYLTTVPSDLIDAGRIDGCSEFGIYRMIILPLLKPALGVLTIYFAMTSWNWFLWPLVVMRAENLFPLNVGLSTFISDYRQRYDELMAASVLCVIPIIALFLSMQKQFVSGLTAGSVKQ